MTMQDFSQESSLFCGKLNDYLGGKGRYKSRARSLHLLEFWYIPVVGVAP